MTAEGSSASGVLGRSGTLGRQRGRVVSVLDFGFVGPGFESHTEHLMDLFYGSPELWNPSATLVNSQLVCLPPSHDSKLAGLS